MCDHSEKIDELASALVKFQGMTACVPRTRSGQNGHRTYQYSPLDAAIDHCRANLLECGLAVMQTVEGDSEDVIIGTRVLHGSGQFIASSFKMRTAGQNPQDQGISITYGRRYGYMAGLGIIPEGEDQDGAIGAKKPSGSKTAPQSSGKPIKPSTKQIEFIEQLATNIDTGKMNAYLEANLGASNLQALTGGKTGTASALISDLKDGKVKAWTPPHDPETGEVTDPAPDARREPANVSEPTADPSATPPAEGPAPPVDPDEYLRATVIQGIKDQMERQGIPKEAVAHWALVKFGHAGSTTDELEIVFNALADGEIEQTYVEED